MGPAGGMYPGKGSEILIAVAGALFFVAIVVGAWFMGSAMGRFDGVLEAWTAERRDCLKKEDRQFADTGFLGMGSGEIHTRRVCVQWMVTR